MSFSPRNVRCTPSNVNLSRQCGSGEIYSALYPCHPTHARLSGRRPHIAVLHSTLPARETRPSRTRTMQVDNAHLSPTERLCCLTQNLCLYCGTNGHYIAACLIHTTCAMVSSVTNELLTINPLSTIVTLTATGFVIPVTALIDSGSAGIFISGDLCRQLQL